MLFSYKGIDNNGEEIKGYITSESKLKAMQDLKYNNNLRVVFYLKEKVDNPYINKLRKETDKILDRVGVYAEEQKRKIKEKQINKKSSKIFKFSDNEIEKINGVLQKLKLLDTETEINPELENKILNIFNDTSLNDSKSRFKNYQAETNFEKPEIRKTKRTKEKKEELKIDWSLIETNRALIDKRSKKLKVKDSELILFTKRLALMLKAGLSLVKTLAIIEPTVSQNFSIILNSIIDDIQNGSSFSTAISKFPKQFDSTYVALVLIGESTGTFSSCLEDVVLYKERGDKLKKKINSATLYPKLLGIILVLVLLLGSKFFIPMFESMFDGQDLELPVLTQIVFGIANVMPKIIISLIVVVSGIVIFSKLSVTFNRFLQYFNSKLLFKVPIINSLILNSNMYTFSSTASLMLKNGLRLNEVLKLTIGVINNIHIKNELGSIHSYVVQGMPLSEAMGLQNYFDTLLSSIVLTGEESGKLDEALYEISIYYDDLLNNKINIMMELIQPVATLLIGVIAVPVILAIYLPIFDMTSGVGL